MSNAQESPISGVEELERDQALSKAIEMFRKAMERDGLTEEQLEYIEERVKAMETREVVESSERREPIEIISDDQKVLIGPPTLTRFEKARIMGARALQLSMGAPPFVEIPEGTKTSLVIAMEELERRVIPIVIRRTLPNGDFQNISISHFA